MPSRVYKRSEGSFAARAYVGGKAVWLGTYRTREEAQEAVVRAGQGALPAAMTVEEWGARWLLVFPGRRNPQSEAHYTQMLRPFLRAHARRRVADITQLEAQTWAVAHPSQVRYLRMMFGKAKRAGIVERNVWEAVETTVRRRPRRAPSAQELEVLVATARGRYDDRFADMMVFTAYTGLRLSEVADVQTGDMHSDGRRLRVRGKRRAGEADPRERTVAVFPAARAAFAAHAPEVGLVWRALDGERWTRFTVAEAMRMICAAALVEDVTFHSLRHFHASWLLDQGASDLDVALQLGHVKADGTVDPSLVRRRYGHPDVEAGLARLEATAG
jgi:integrase